MCELLAENLGYWEQEAKFTLPSPFRTVSDTTLTYPCVLSNDTTRLDFNASETPFLAPLLLD